MVANGVGRCSRSTTGSDLRRISIETGLVPWTSPSWKIQSCVSKSTVQEGDGFRIQYLKKLINARFELRVIAEDTSRLDD